MAALYTLFADQSTSEFFTLLLLGLLFLGVVLYKYDIIEKRHLSPTGLDKTLIYASIAITLFCGMLLLGKLVVPENVVSLLQLLGLSNLLRTMTLCFQEVVLGILGLMM